MGDNDPSYGTAEDCQYRQNESCDLISEIKIIKVCQSRIQIELSLRFKGGCVAKFI